MGLITHTNIVVDNFNYGKVNPYQHYVYFLTHFHSDHWVGLSNSWNYGKIYCSNITKRLILNKFPNVPDIEGLEVNIPYSIYLNKNKTLKIEVYAFDANHCPGAVMFLFKGHMGTILHTGDFRFHKEMILENPVMFPLERRTPDLAKCSIPIDEVIFDNTFCDPVFKFPPREKALKDLIEIIDKHREKKRVLISTDLLGKEEIFVSLAEHYKTLIVVNQTRFCSILAMDYRPELFTTNSKEGWIEVITKDQKWKRLKDKKEECICITPTGWVNLETYASRDGRKYIVPYSAHSNFEEMETFIRSINPAILKCVVRNKKAAEDIENIGDFTSYMVSLKQIKQRGYELFVKHYTAPESLSEEYKFWMKPENKEKLVVELGLKIPEEKKAEMNTFLFERKHRDIVDKKKVARTGAKMKDIELNTNLRKDERDMLKKNQSLSKTHSMPPSATPELSFSDFPSQTSEFRKSNTAFDPHPPEVPEESGDTQPFDSGGEEVEAASTASYRDGSRIGFELRGSASVSPLLSANRSLSPMQNDMEIEAFQIEEENEIRKSSRSLSRRSLSDPNLNNPQTSRARDDGSESGNSVIQVEKSPSNRGKARSPSPIIEEESDHEQQQANHPPGQALLSQYIKNKIQDKEFIHKMQLKRKGEQLKKATSLPDDLPGSSSFVPKGASREKSPIVEEEKENPNFADMTPEEYIDFQKRKEAQAIDLIRKLNGGKGNVALPKHLQTFMNRKDVGEDDSLVVHDNVAFGEKMMKRKMVAEAKAAERLENSKLDQTTLMKKLMKKSMSAEDSFGPENNMFEKQRELMKKKSLVHDTPQFGNSQESNHGKDNGRMEIEQEGSANKGKNKEKEKEKEKEKAGKGKKQRNNKGPERMELWDDDSEPEARKKSTQTPKKGSLNVSQKEQQPIKKKANLIGAAEIKKSQEMEKKKDDIGRTSRFERQIMRDNDMNEENDDSQSREMELLKGEVIRTNTKKTDARATIQKMLGIKNQNRNTGSPQQRESPRVRETSPKAPEKINIIEKKVIKNKEIDLVREFRTEKPKNKGDVGVDVSVTSQQGSTHFRVEFNEDGASPHLHIYSKNSKVSFELGNFQSKVRKKSEQIESSRMIEEPNSESNEDSRGLLKVHDDWLDNGTQESFAEKKDRRRETESDEEEVEKPNNQKPMKPKLLDRGNLRVETLSQDIFYREPEQKSREDSMNNLFRQKESRPAVQQTIPIRQNNQQKKSFLELEDSQNSESFQGSQSQQSEIETPVQVIKRGRGKETEKKENNQRVQTRSSGKKNETKIFKARQEEEKVEKNKKTGKLQNFHDDWLESNDSKKSTPGKDWQIKAANFQQSPDVTTSNDLFSRMMNSSNNNNKQQKNKEPEYLTVFSQRERKRSSEMVIEESEESRNSVFLVSSPQTEEIQINKKPEEKKVEKGNNGRVFRGRGGKESFGRTADSPENTMEILREKPRREEDAEDIIFEDIGETKNKIKSSSRKKSSKKSTGDSAQSRGTQENPIAIDLEEFSSLDILMKRKRGRKRKADAISPLVSVSKNFDLTVNDPFQYVDIAPLKSLKKVKLNKPPNQETEENLMELINIFIDKKSLKD